MRNRLREIFDPTPEEQIEMYEKLLQLHKEQIGQCSTCVHFFNRIRNIFI